MKKRVTLTISKDVLQQVDNTIDGSLVKNRSHAFELLVTKALGKRMPSKAFILAGGNTGSNIPESMIKVGDKPILQYNIELLKSHGITEIIISLGSNGDQIKRHFGDGSSLDVSIKYVEEKDALGTAGPLNLVGNMLDKTFVMLNADEIKDIDLDDMFKFHKDHDGFATIALTTVANPSKYGVAVMNGNKINSFFEKPDKTNVPSNLINAGLYIMDPEVLDLVPEGYAKLEEDLFPKLAGEENLYGYPFSGKWLDPGAKGRYKITIKKKDSTKKVE